jgi:hypothetical protein
MVESIMLGQGDVKIKIQHSEHLQDYVIIEFRQSPSVRPLCLYLYLTRDQLKELAEAAKEVVG